MVNLYNYLINLITNYTIFGYLLISILAFLESFAFIGLIVPGSIAVIVGGFLAAHGTMNLKLLFIFVVFAAVAGDSLSFHLGKTKKIAFKQENKFFKPELLSKGKDFFEKYGAKSIFLGRFIGWVRPVIPFTAGLFKLDTKSFLFWNILSGLLWGVSHLALGYFFGRSWQLITLWSTRVSILFAILTVFLVLFYLLKWFALRKGKLIYQLFISLWHSVKEAVLENSEVQELVKNHRTFFSWLKERFNKNTFWGLPLTLFSLSLIYVLALFGGIVEDFINSELITQIDVRIENLLLLFRNSGLNSLFFWLSFLAKWQLIAVFSLTATFLFWLWNKKEYIFSLLISLSGSFIFTAAGKVIFQRARPAAAVYQLKSFSFPSAEATTAVAFYGFLAYFLIKNLSQWKRKINTLFITLLIIIFIGFSRLYLGLHYFSDIWAGYLLGAIWLIIAIAVTEYLLRAEKMGKNKISIKYKKIISIITIFAALLSYPLFAYNYPLPQFNQKEVEERVLAAGPLSVFEDQSLKYTETLLGTKEEPLSFIILAGSDTEVNKLLENSGWQPCERVNIFNLYKLAKAGLLKNDYPKAPITPSFWNSKVPDFNFEKSAETKSPGQRYQLRIWKSSFILNDGSRIYLGKVNFSTGFKWGVIHQISPDLDAARENLADNLNNSALLASSEQKDLVAAQSGKNFSGDPFFTDGNLYIFFLK